jgi:hypothetical protein
LSCRDTYTLLECSDHCADISRITLTMYYERGHDRDMLKILAASAF